MTILVMHYITFTSPRNRLNENILRTGLVLCVHMVADGGQPGALSPTSKDADTDTTGHSGG